MEKFLGIVNGETYDTVEDFNNAVLNASEDGKSYTASAFVTNKSDEKTCGCGNCCGCENCQCKKEQEQDKLNVSEEKIVNSEPEQENTEKPDKEALEKDFMSSTNIVIDPSMVDTTEPFGKPDEYGLYHISEKLRNILSDTKNKNDLKIEAEYLLNKFKNRLSGNEKYLSELELRRNCIKYEIEKLEKRRNYIENEIEGVRPKISKLKGRINYYNEVLSVLSDNKDEEQAKEKEMKFFDEPSNLFDLFDRILFSRF